MGTDFFDDDLLRNDSSGRVLSEEQGGGEQGARPSGALNLARQKEMLSQHVAGAVKDMETLKHRQGELEREKARLQELARKQEEYERGKADIIEKLGRSIIIAEKEEEKTIRNAEMLSETKTRFKHLLAEIRKVDEGAWGDDNFQTELDCALALVENAVMEYKKGIARVDASGWPSGGPASAARISAGSGSGDNRSFLSWLKAGCAFSIPLLIAGLVIVIVYLMLVPYFIQ